MLIDGKSKHKKVSFVDEQTIKIEFDFDREILAIVKEIPGRRFYDKGTKYWTAPLLPANLKTLIKADFSIDEKLIPYIRQEEKAQEEIEVEGLKRELFPFQKKGVAFIESRNGRALIGDEMGLGKTIQALAWLALHPNRRPAIVVCPAHLKLNWAREIEKTLPDGQNVQILFGTNTDRPITGDIIIINYDILANTYEEYRDTAGKKRFREIERTGWVDYIIDIKPEVVIIDEAHYIKSNTAFRSKSTRKLAGRCKHVIALTGTPIVNRPIEGFNIIQAIDSKVFPNFWHYTQRYCGAKHTGFGWDFTGATNKDELHKKLTETIMVRRKKAEVLPDLPDKIHSHIPIEIENPTEYANAEADFIEYLKETKGEESAEKAKQAEHLVKIEAMKQLAIKGKMKQAVQWVNDFLQNNGEKLVVFAVHKSVVDALMKEFKDVAVKVDGSVSAANRDKAVEAFQNNPDVKLFLGNIQAAGTGLTLTAASSVAFLELPWTPGELVQAEDRCHRIGQKGTVNIYYLLAGGTIEEKIAELLDEKKAVLGAVLDGQEVEEIQTLTELIKSYEGEK